MASRAHLGADQLPQLVSKPAPPPDGAILLYAKTDWNLYLQRPDGVEMAVGSGGSTGSTGGGAATLVQSEPPASPTTGQLWWDTDEPLNLTQPNLALVTEYPGSSVPPTPASGLTLFTKFKARRMLAVEDALGHETALQPALFSNKVARMTAVNSVTTPTLDGLAVTHLHNGTNTPNNVALDAASFYGSLSKVRYSIGTTAPTSCGVRSSSAQWFLSSTANMGGFFFVARFGLATGSTTTRGFCGLSSQTTPYAPGTNPSAQLNQIGFGWDAGHTTMRFMSAGATSGAAANVDLGANFPVSSAFATNFFEVRLFAPSGGGQVVYWSATRLNDGYTVQGGPVTTNLPALSTLLAAHINYASTVSSSNFALDVQSLYIETEN